MTLFELKKPEIFLVLYFLVSISLFAQDKPIRNITDDSGLRISIKDTWLTEAPARVISKSPAIHNLPGGGRVELRIDQNQNEIIIILAREFSDVRRNISGPFPGWAQGSWIFTRNKKTGEAIRIRVFLRSDPYMYVQFRPAGSDKCSMDVVLHEAFIRRSIPLAVPLERLYTMRLDEILLMAGERFPIKYYEPEPAFYRDSRAFISKLRENITGLKFADDGAQDENGNYVYIKTGLAQKGEPGLNCSGFAKWVVDGIVFPFTGRQLAIDPLKAPFGNRGSTFTEIWEEMRDPFFGLDWIRNLASAAGTVLRSPAFGTLEEIEVRSEPFSQLIIRGDILSSRSYPGFLENAGYSFDGLEPLLYILAIDEPGRFYLAAVNNEIGPRTSEDNPRGRPRMRQYFHIAVLVPYFNEYGFFQVAVFESAAETSFAAFKTRYPGQYVNLVRIPVN
jgi:hypothetical protein